MPPKKKGPIDPQERADWLENGVLGKLFDNADEVVKKATAITLAINNEIASQLNDDEQRQYYAILALSFEDFDQYRKDVDLHRLNKEIGSS